MTARIGRGATRRAISSTLWRRFAAETSIQGSKAESATVAAWTREARETAAAAAPARRKDRRDTPMATALESPIIVACDPRGAPSAVRLPADPNAPKISLGVMPAGPTFPLTTFGRPFEPRHRQAWKCVPEGRRWAESVANKV